MLFFKMVLGAAIRSGFVAIFLGLLISTGCSQQVFDVIPQNQLFEAKASYNNKVDILFMIDNSSSMLQHQDRLAREIEPLIKFLNSTDLDYRLAAVSSDWRPNGRGSGGKLLGSPSFLTKSTQGLVDLLKSRILLGESGTDIESGLESVQRALQTEAGRSFLREDALLAIIVLADEDDYSPGHINDYRSFLDQIKQKVPGYSRGWVLNFLGIIQLDGNCRTMNNIVEVGARYMELARLSGGIQASICETSLSRSVANIQTRIVQILSEYPLRYPPDLSTVKVYINDRLVPQSQTNGWWYIPETMKIRFSGDYLPKPFDRIQVDYKPAGGA
ncbi:MAG: VWA domain-containing protein [Bdellovibrionaceae bacterium]|nr:VWA domain-containing protein [Pseudobdellovibrionaceae bacterium]MDW8189728.1 hypothetical protein [Pseudobdellovibrionaceae bacterium]